MRHLFIRRFENLIQTFRETVESLIEKRINRINKKVFSKLFIHNFIPRPEVQGELKNWQIAKFRLKLINGIFGNDTKILEKYENIDRVIEKTKESIKDTFSLKNDTPDDGDFIVREEMF